VSQCEVEVIARLSECDSDVKVDLNERMRGSCNVTVH